MKTKMVSLGIVLALVFTGCSLIPQYSRPDAPVPGQWPSGPAYREDPFAPEAPLAADLHWQEFFTDDALRQFIDMALSNNRNLRVAALNVQRARAFYRIQRAELMPRVDAAGSAYQERVPADLSSTGNRMTVEEYRAELGISAWEIDFFGRICSLGQSVLEAYFATEQARRSAQVLLVSEVADAYLTLAADRENLQLARSTLASQQAAYRLIRHRFEVGISPELDLRQVQTRVDAARVDMARFTEQVARDENALTLLVGASVLPALSPPVLSDISPLGELSVGLTSEVLLQRPDILQAESLLKAANANIGAARAALFPRIALTTAVGTASSDLSGLFESGQGTWMFSPTVAVPIFDPRTWSALKVTRMEQEIAVAQYEGAIQAAFRDVADTLAQRGTLSDQMEGQPSLVEATLAAYRISTARYEKGTDIYLNVLDAQRSLYAAQQGLIAIRLAELANQVRLYAVLGGGTE
jgi:multidrug efflux system outer membrane protein